MANPVDPYAPISNPVVDATAAADPSVAIMRAAAADRARNLQAFQQKQALESTQEQRTQASSALAQAHNQHVVAQDQSQANRNTMTGDIAVSQPAYGPRVHWDQLDPSVPQSFADRYGIENMGAARDAWEKNIPQQNRVIRGKASALGLKVAPDATDDEVQSQIADEEQKRQQAATTTAQAKQDATEQRTSSAQDMAKQRVITQIQRQVQNNQQVRFYQGAKANYDSIAQNVSKPVRTGADDAFLMQAAATMEAPGRSPTGNDVKEFMRANGIRGNLDVLANRFDALINNSPEAQAKQGRILSEDLAKQIAAAAKNALETRRSSITESMTPFVNRLEDLGEDPYRHLPKSLVDDVYGVTGQQQPASQPQLSPEDQAAIQWANSNPNDPRSARIKAMHGVK